MVKENNRCCSKNFWVNGFTPSPAFDDDALAVPEIHKFANSFLCRRFIDDLDVLMCFFSNFQNAFEFFWLAV